MKVGDLVTVKPSKSGVYLIIDEDPARESNWSDHEGTPLGKLYEIHDPYVGAIVDMHEKWIEVVNEGR